ncbi:glycoside hydrolase [Sphingobium sufflavum]|uniref:glycosyl hydrolase n=1 Tax=Sphingobium sufflavum TaxID=1129547 RepID=UPI001F35B500|nr:glycosyl hydrolase [Sphingobium sufflavum]MCE7798272.1 glycoside hydrolase [Sphingobium sufflavum]
MARLKRSVRALWFAAGLAACGWPTMGAAQGNSGGEDRLLEGFRNPPESARPRVWWHWVNGNISADGIEKDLEWLARMGIGGAQAFDVARPMPSLVDHPLTYMSPDWKAAFNVAVKTSRRLGLELGIASSPGWSESGGPWVPAADGMKKLVWSETFVKGGRRFQGVLATPPSVAGPYQGLGGETHHGTQATDYYRDALLLAVREDRAEGAVRAHDVTVNGQVIDGGPLQDGRLDDGIALPGALSSGPGSIQYAFAASTTIRSARLFVANLPGSTLSGPLIPRLEASDDGIGWRRVSDFTLSAVPTTVSFAPVTARQFRLLFVRGKPGDVSGFTPAPGVDMRSAAGLGGGGGAKPVVADFQLSTQARVNAFERKAAFAIADDYYQLDGQVGDNAKGIEPGSVIDLTSKMAGDGRLDWTAPKGNWRILRIGYSLTGKTNAPATVEATGLEVDKYDGAAVERYLTTYLGTYRSITGPGALGGQGLNAFVTDSTEVRPANWTPNLIAQFQRLRGYDPRPWLPTMTGIIIGSRQQSDAFLYDFRRTLGELAASEHYGTIARVAKAEGMTVYGEALEGNRAISSLGDDLDLRRHADIPMGAMWSFGAGGPRPHYLADMRGAASVAHLYGRPIAAAESLTSIMQPWAFSPADLQPMIDMEFLSGVNRPVIHSVVQQPRDDRKPGMSLQGFGQFFGRHEAWAELAKPWIDYLSRTSYLLQQGRNVADVAYFYGEETPVSVLAAEGYPADVPHQNGYDFISATGLLSELSVEKGEIVSKGGARYRGIYLGGTSTRMTLPVLKRLGELVEAGATVIGMPPIGSPSLVDDATETNALTRRLWSGGGDTKIGQGRVIASRDVAAALASAGVEPDFAVMANAAGADIPFVHRTIENGEIYFLSNRKARTESFEAHFRVKGRIPHIWRAATGEITPVSYRIEGSGTIVPLEMAPHESFFVIFRQPVKERQVNVPKMRLSTVTGIVGPWTVSFEPGRGAPASIPLDRLMSLSEHPSPGVKYFSGMATYETRFTLSSAITADRRPLLLDLGKVGDVAEVTLNGRLVGTVWKAPYHLDVRPFLRAGDNRLRVRVANLWVNRLIGDQQPGAEKVTATAIATYTAKAPLRSSGLVGPVSLLRKSSD